MIDENVQLERLCMVADNVCLDSDKMRTMPYEWELANVALNGVISEDRTGTGTISLFGTQTRYNLRDSFPLITTKKVHWKSVIEELLWFLRGETNINTLNSTIWNEWADENGELGPIYGKQWRSWETFRSRECVDDPIDQIKNVIEGIRKDPYGRRHIVSAWNVEDLPRMALAPCHCLFQFYVRNGELSCQLYQRSADMFLGVPFNVASYSALTYLIAAMTGLKPGEFIHTIGDAHIYLNHIDQVIEQLGREPFDSPTLEICRSIGVAVGMMSTEEILANLLPSAFLLTDYNPHPAIKAPVAV